MSDAFDLQRFVLAQEAYGTYQGALKEIRSGLKTGHWIWFVFPQIVGLGRSSTDRHYAISDMEEARAYLAHPVLGPRLEVCCRARLALPGNDPDAIFGSLDAMKLRSSMALFAQASDGGVFSEVLDRYFGNRPDATTLELLEHGS